MKKTLLLFAVLVLTGALVRADLKTWLHGPQPTATAGPPDAKAATVSFAPNVAADKAILDFLQAFAEALRVHDGKSLTPRLSERYAIDDLPDEHDPVDFFMQAMVKVKAPDEIVVTGVEREGETRIAKTEFRAADRETKQRTFKFDANGKLLSADFFTLQRRHGG
jgi:hypothetical protein